MNILLVDDNADHGELIRRAFAATNGGIVLSMAASLSEARQYLAEHNPDLIISDYRLPDGRGTELLPGDAEKRTLPIIMLTGHGDETLAAKVIRAGALDYIVKSEGVFADMPHIAKRAMREWQQIIGRRQAEQALSQSEQSLRNLVEADINALVVHKDFHLVYANPAARVLFEAPEGVAMPDVNVLDYVHPDYRNFTRLRVLRMLRRNKALPAASIMMVTPSGRHHHIEIASTPITFRQQRAALSIIRDVSEQKRADEKIRILSSSVEQASESVVITDRHGVIEYVNPAFSRITGYSEAEAIGRNPRILKSGKHKAHFYEGMWDLLIHGNAWKGRIIDKKKDGSLYPALLTISPIVDNAGEISHFVGVQQDISEYEAMEQQFQQAQKMEAVGTLVGGIAHDFNNMLAGITGNLYLAKGKAAALPEVVKRLDNIQHLSVRAADMIKQLLAFARQDRVDMKLVPFTYYLKEVIKLVRISIPESITFNQSVCSDSLQIYGDNTQLHQVVMNLISNARDAVDGVAKPVISIRLEPYAADTDFISRHDVKGGSFARLSVEDNGCGIAQEHLDHIFEPYFTRKEQGKGTGLGLAMVFGAIKTHRGIIEVSSREGEGSRFDIYLPLQAQQQSDEPVEKQEVVMGQGELILLADDEQHIVETGREVLEKIGYRVVIASNGYEAVDRYKEHAPDIDLVILDVVMPGIGGVEAARRLRKINPQLRVIFATGYDKDAALPQGAIIADEAVLSKPFSIAALSQTVRKMLDA